MLDFESHFDVFLRLVAWHNHGYAQQNLVIQGYTKRSRLIKLQKQ